jgi:serine/threonine protein kinase
MTTSSHPTVKVADFGWSVWYVKSGARQSTLCGTSEYLPPELMTTGFQRRSYEAQYVDSWALGVLGLELLLSNTPFAGTGDQGDRPAVYRRIREFAGLDRSILAWTREPAYASMLDEFLQRAPLHRLSATASLERYGKIWGLQSTPMRPTVQQRKQVFQRGNHSPVPSHL